MIVIRMVQTTKSNWRVESPNGAIIQDNLHFNNSDEAETYVKNFCTSFHDWHYVIVCL